MFNLLGSIFGYGQSSPTVATEQSTSNNNEEASLSTSGLVVASTTPTVNQSTQTTKPAAVVDSTNSVAGATTSSQASSNLNNSTTSTSPADWVIVDRSEAAAEKCNKAAVDVSTSMTASAMIDDLHKSTVAPVVTTATPNITDSVMLGSFFDKNAAEDEEFNKKYGNAAAMHQTKDWLITPLPCLTSITASQRSIVDNDPMENLLIEHPSMSVFVAATSSAEDNDDDETATLEDEEMNVFYFLFDIKEEEEKKQPALRELEKNVVMVKSMSEKRKALGSPKIDSKPPSKRHQKHKKNKKSSSSNSSTGSVSPASSSSTINSNAAATGNKENLTVLLPHDYKKQSASGAQSLAQALLLTKNQMKRANKNSVFKNTSANNVKHRKYHKLQQPFQQSSRPVF